MMMLMIMLMMTTMIVVGDPAVNLFAIKAFDKTLDAWDFYWTAAACVATLNQKNLTMASSKHLLLVRVEMTINIKILFPIYRLRNELQVNFCVSFVAVGILGLVLAPIDVRVVGH